MTVPALLVPADPLVERRPDPHFAPEAAAARGLGATVALLDHDALLGGDATAAVRRVPRDSGEYWYRGWMVPADRYADLAAALAERGAGLRVAPADYRAAHELPGWYAHFAAATPDSVWLPRPPGAPPSVDEAAALVAPLGPGPAVVKDYVKSRKHEWAEACFIPDLADTAHAHRVVARMVELQGDFLAGGVVVRRFEPFQRVGGRAVEARVWWVDGRPVLTGAHPDTPDVVGDPDLSAIEPLVRCFGPRFVTTDVALRDDGVWRIVEVGDGQVSDLPRGADPAAVLARLS
ncbi:ATP-grasp domain-containing protein [Catellatospora sp. KI3]|uniref:ATP-grasp domain-containing protein n=1 Tax=Catellatospora sp. KI3 TaxID=3041620 RepID=UPI002482F268|nr:ATP-grasp domain-containing protein [Catellatospora sp. KI3]MDI1466247.1 ATP-grasp domain-containing protein [Catellatospora sp. KI3]